MCVVTERGTPHPRVGAHGLQLYSMPMPLGEEEARELPRDLSLNNTARDQGACLTALENVQTGRFEFCARLVVVSSATVLNTSLHLGWYGCTIRCFIEIVLKILNLKSTPPRARRQGGGATLRSLYPLCSPLPRYPPLSTVQLYYVVPLYLLIRAIRLPRPFAREMGRLVIV